MPDQFKFELGMKLPGEELLIKMLDTYDKTRASMTEDTRDGWDRLLLAQARGWHNGWVSLGWPGEKV